MLAHKPPLCGMANAKKNQPVKLIAQATPARFRPEAVVVDGTPMRTFSPNGLSKSSNSGKFSGYNHPAAAPWSSSRTHRLLKRRHAGACSECPPWSRTDYTSPGSAASISDYVVATLVLSPHRRIIGPKPRRLRDEKRPCSEERCQPQQH